MIETLAVITSVVAAFASLLSVVVRNTHKQDRKLCVLLRDKSGNPIPAVLVVGPDGVRISANAKGAVFLPENWEGQVISVREPDGVQLTELRLPRDSGPRFMVTVTGTEPVAPGPASPGRGTPPLA